MIRTRLIAPTLAATVSLAFPSAALANTCVNLARPANPDEPSRRQLGRRLARRGTNPEEEWWVPIHVPSAHCNGDKAPQSGDRRAIQLHCHEH